MKRGQKMEASVGIMDSQSVKWGNNAALNGIDGNKKVKGIKRHVIVDKNGFLIAVMVTIANVHDGKTAYLLMRVLKEMCSYIKVILADGGYRGELIENIKMNFGYAIQVVVSTFKEQGFRPIKKGTWVGGEVGYNFEETLIFNNSGTGKWDEDSFNYTTNSNKVVIDYGDESPETWTYSVSLNTLDMTAEDRVSYHFTKK